MKEAKYLIRKGQLGGGLAHFMSEISFWFLSGESFKMRDLKDGEKRFVDAGTQA